MATRTVRRTFYSLRPQGGSPELKIRVVATNSTKKEALRRQVEAAKNLDRTIVPTDLSETLEQHRAMNRGSVVSHKATKSSDSEIIRPSFLEQKAPVLNRNRKAGHSIKRILVASGNLSAHWDENHIKMLEDLQKSARWIDPKADQYRTNLSLHKERIKYLRKYEEPLGPLPTTDDRLAQFEVLRRFAAVLHKEQHKLVYRGKVLDMDKRMMEYEGSYVPLKPVVTKGPEPWARRPQWPYTGYQRLEHEMKSFEQWMALTQEEVAAREAVHQRVLEVIRKNTPDYSVEMFGSQTTGLALPTSDLDLRIFPTSEAEESHLDIASAMNPTKEDLAKPFPTEKATPQTISSALEPLNPDHEDQILATMSKLQNTLTYHPEFEGVVLNEGRFPLVGATHKPSGLSIQLVASQGSSHSRRAIQTYLSEYPTLRPIYTVVKTMLDLRGLSNVWVGGFGSYSIFMMVVAALKHHCKPGDGMAKQLLGVLEFWADFNTRTQGVAIDPPIFFEKKLYATEEEKELMNTDLGFNGRCRMGRPRYYHSYLLCLQDPADAMNDLGKKSWAIKDVQATFRDVHAGLLKDIHDPNNHSHVKPLLRRVVGRCDRTYDDYRTKVELYGDKYVEHDKEDESRQEKDKVNEKEVGSAWLS